MALFQTTILPTDDPVLARNMFTEMIHEQPWILMVVLGTSAEAEQTVQRADRMAFHQGDEGWRVVWARQPADIQVVCDALQADPAALKALVSTSRAFVTSLSDVVRDVIRGDEPPPSNTRLLKAFLTAEAGT